MTIDVIHGRAWRELGPMPFRPPYLGPVHERAARTRIGDRPEWRVAGDLSAYLGRRQIISPPPQEERRTATRRAGGPRLRVRPGSGETARSYRRANDRPYWIPFYGMYGDLPPGEVLCGRI
jgi:hypothetical protein